MAGVRFTNLTKVYPSSGKASEVTAVKGISFDVREGEFMVLVGPSGCGKSTTLRMLAGLESITSGECYIGDRLVNDVPPKDRDIAMVFQNYAVFQTSSGWWTVYVSQRATRKIYVHLNHYLVDEKAD